MRTLRPVSRDKANLQLRASELMIAFVAPVIAIALRSPESLQTFNAAGLLYAGVGAAITLAIMLHHRISAIMLRYFNAFDAFMVLRAAGLSVMLTAAALFCINRLDGVPRSLPFIHFFVLALLLLIACYVRGEFRVYMQQLVAAMSGAPWRENALVIGANHCAMIYIRLAMLGRPRNRRVLAILDSNPKLQGRCIAGCSVIGELMALEAVILEYAIHGVRVDTIFLAIPRQDLSLAEASIVERVAHKYNCTVTSPEALFDESVADFQPSIAPAAQSIVRRTQMWRMKRGIDVVVAAVSIVALAPLLLPGAILLLKDIGWPILFWQERLGRDGHPIRIIKFRTLATKTQQPTACGRWLRRLRIDELPQLWNILRGEMSLVGPRPLLASEQGNLDSLRLSVRPGLTGWAQVCGANLCSIEEKTALDEWYIGHASLALDARIILWTVNVLLRGERRREEHIEMAVSARALRLASQADLSRSAKLTLVSDSAASNERAAPPLVGKVAIS